MAEILSYPFRLAPNGSAATVEQSSDEANAEQIAMLALTRYGERPMIPAFGLTDPVMAGFHGTELAAQVARWGPPVRVTSVKTRQVGQAEQAVRVEFT